MSAAPPRLPPGPPPPAGGAAPGGMSAIGVLGGSFDPPHLGHLVLAAAARRALALDEVLVVPAGDPWRKRDRRVTPAALRLRMVRAAVADLPWATVDAREVRRPGPSYTVDTMRELVAERPAVTWWVIGGRDLVDDLPHWREPEALLDLCRLAIAERPPTADGATGGGGPPPPRALAARIAAATDPVPMPLLRISSTALRARCAAAGPPAVLLPAGVRRVIGEAGLYRAAPGAE